MNRQTQSSARDGFDGVRIVKPRNSLLSAPDQLRTDEYILRPIRASDARLDYEAVMESKEFLRKWEQTGWPEDNFTVEANRDDLMRMEQRHVDGESYSYTIASPTAEQCLGCVYIFPTKAKLFTKAKVTPIGSLRWSEFDVAAYFWVRTSRMIDKLDERLLEAVTAWLQREWRVRRQLVVTSELVEQQVALLESSGHSLCFELAYPNKAGRELAYARGSAERSEARLGTPDRPLPASGTKANSP